MPLPDAGAPDIMTFRGSLVEQFTLSVLLKDNDTCEDKSVGVKKQALNKKVKLNK